MRLVLLIVCVFLFSETLYAQAYNKYCNPRYGFCVDYPSDLKIDIDTDNGDGLAWINKNRDYRMIVSAGFNVEDESLDEYRKNYYIDDFDQITYSQIGKNWFALSGYKGNMIIYKKVWLSDICHNALHLEYSIKNKIIYNQMVEHIVKSFKPNLRCE